MNKQRRHFADHEKVAILKRHLIDKVLCWFSLKWKIAPVRVSC